MRRCRHFSWVDRTVVSEFYATIWYSYVWATSEWTFYGTAAGPDDAHDASFSIRSNASSHDASARTTNFRSQHAERLLQAIRLQKEEFKRGN